MPPDHIASRERPPFAGEMLDRLVCERYGAAKDLAFEKPYDRSSASVVLSNANFPVLSNKARALGSIEQQDLFMQNGGYDRHSQTSSPCFVLSSTVSGGSAERGVGNSLASSICSGSGGINRHLEVCGHILESQVQGKDFQRPEPFSSISVSQEYESSSVDNDSDFHDLGRSKFSRMNCPDTSRVSHKCREAGYTKMENVNGVYSKLGLANCEAEGRLDRYGSSSSREQITPKENFRYSLETAWTYKDKALCTSLSSLASPGSLSSSAGRDTTTLHGQATCLGRSPSQDSSIGSGMWNDSSPHDTGGSSPKKRPRLTWGQGLAKYEKMTKDLPHLKTAGDEMHTIFPTVIGDENSGAAFSRQESSISFEQPTPTSEPVKVRPYNIKVCPQDSNSVTVVTASLCQSEVMKADEFDQQGAILKPAGLVPMSSDDSKCTTSTTCDPAVDANEQVSLKLCPKDVSRASKHWLMQQVEKLELQVDLVEKELATLGSGSEACAGAVMVQDDWNRKLEEPSMPLRYFNSCVDYMDLDVVSGTTKLVKVDKNSTPNEVIQMDGLQNVQDECISDKCSSIPILIFDHCNMKIMDKEGTAGCILKANKELACQASESLCHILHGVTNDNSKLYCTSNEAAIWATGEEDCERQKFLKLKVACNKQSLRLRERLSTLKYHLLQVEAGYCKRSVPSKEGVINLQRAYLRMPSMLLDEKEREYYKLMAKNALVDDPVATEAERELVNPWSSDEKKIFLEKYGLLGKNFRKIATFLPQKTVADCVVFYYRNQKSEDFTKIHRKHKLKKRRENARSNASYLSTSTSICGRHQEGNPFALERLSLVAGVARRPPLDGSRATIFSGGNVNAKFLRDRALIKQVNNLETPKSANLARGRRMLTHVLKATKEEMELQWSKSEKDSFVTAVAMFGTNFPSIASHIGSRTEAQCRAFFSKMHKQMGLDEVVQHNKSVSEADETKELSIEHDKDVLDLEGRNKLQEKEEDNRMVGIVGTELKEPKESDSLNCSSFGLFDGAGGMVSASLLVPNEQENMLDQDAIPTHRDDHGCTVNSVTGLGHSQHDLLHDRVDSCLPDSMGEQIEEVALRDNMQVICATTDCIKSNREPMTEMSKTVLPTRSIECCDSCNVTEFQNMRSSVVLSDCSLRECNNDKNENATDTCMGHSGGFTWWTKQAKENVPDVKDSDQHCGSLSVFRLKQKPEAKLGAVLESIRIDNGSGGALGKREANDIEFIRSGHVDEYLAGKLDIINNRGFVAPRNDVSADKYFATGRLAGGVSLPTADTTLDVLGSLPDLMVSCGHPPLSTSALCDAMQWHHSYLPPLPNQVVDLQTNLHLHSPQAQQENLEMQQQPPHGSLPCQRFPKVDILQQSHRKAVDAVLQQQLHSHLTHQQYHTSQVSQELQITGHGIYQPLCTPILNQVAQLHARTAESQLRNTEWSSSQQQIFQWDEQLQRLKLRVQQQHELLSCRERVLSQLSETKMLGNPRLQQGGLHLHGQHHKQFGIEQHSKQAGSVNLRMLGIMPALACGVNAMESPHGKLQNTVPDCVQQCQNGWQSSQDPLKSPCYQDSRVHADVKLFGQSLLVHPAAASSQQSHSSPSSFTPREPSLEQPTTSGRLLFQSDGWEHLIGTTKGWPCFAGVVTPSNGNDVQACQHAKTGREEEERALTSHSSCRTGQNLFGLDHNVTRKDHSVLYHVTQNAPDAAIPRCDNGIHAKLSDRKDDYSGFLEHRAPGLQASVPPGLPRVLDALVALAEWRLQNSNSSFNKITEEFLSKSWEALQRDPGSLLVAGKASASQGQGGLETIQQLKESIFKYQLDPRHLSSSTAADGATGSSGILEG